MKTKQETALIRAREDDEGANRTEESAKVPKQACLPKMRGDLYQLRKSRKCTADFFLQTIAACLE